MYNFNSINKSPRSKGGGSPERKVEGIEEIEWVESPDRFSEVFSEAKLQFAPIAEALESGKKIRELKEINKTIPYLSFRKYLEGQKIDVSQNLLQTDDEDNDLISAYDELIETLKKFEFHNEKELKNTLDKAHHLFEELERK